MRNNWFISLWIQLIVCESLSAAPPEEVNQTQIASLIGFTDSLNRNIEIFGTNGNSSSAESLPTTNSEIVAATYDAKLEEAKNSEQLLNDVKNSPSNKDSERKRKLVSSEIASPKQRLLMKFNRAMAMSEGKHIRESYGKKFKHPSDLKWHITKHSDERLFNCTECDKGFKRKGTLMMHMRQVHCDETPYKCRVCNKTSKTELSLNLHMRYVHTDHRPFNCSECNKGFKTKCELGRHMRRVHSDKTNTGRT